MAETNKSNLISLPIYWHYRLLGNILMIAIITALCTTTIIIKTNFIGTKLENLSEAIIDYGSNLGFTLDDIILEGREKTSRDEVTSALNLQRGNNFLKIDVEDIKTKLETLPWIKKAFVKKSFFPNILQIKVTEKTVQSLWQIGDLLHPIDEDGNIINAEYKPSHQILLIVGSKAPENIPELLPIIKQDEEIFKRIKVANYISGRRWNIILDDIRSGMIIKLPEENIDVAWKKLIKLNTQKGLLKRKLTVLDLRLPDKVIVKLEKTSVKENVKESKI